MKGIDEKVTGGGFVERINPFVDWSFKRIFGTDSSKDLLLDFLNDLFAGEKKIKEIRYCNNEILPEEKDEKTCLVDILCTDNNGDNYLIEMQNAQQEFFMDRALYYTCRLITASGKRGDVAYSNIKGVYTVCFLNFIIDEMPYFRTDMVITDNNNHQYYKGKFRMVYIQLGRFEKKKVSECKDNTELWLFLLKNLTNMMEDVVKDLAERKAAFKKLLEITRVEALSEEERQTYENTVKAQEAYISSIEFAIKKGTETGLAIGKAKGIEEGMAKGIEEGMAKGTEQGIAQSKLVIARKMKAKGIDIPTISCFTGLTAEEINNL